MVYFRDLNKESVLILRNESNVNTPQLKNIVFPKKRRIPEDEILYFFEENDTLDGLYWKISSSYYRLLHACGILIQNNSYYRYRDYFHHKQQWYKYIQFH